MSLSLLTYNTCGYGGCGLHFANQYDLIAHIEFTHIPLIEDEHRQKSTLQMGDESRSTAAPNLPLSCVQRVFNTPYRPTPCRPEIVKVSFNHYRKRNNIGNITSTPSTTAMSQSLTPKRDDDTSNDSSIGDDLEECVPSDPETRFRCQLPDCGKRFKNTPGLRFHMRVVHSVVVGEDMQGAVVTAEGVIPSSTHPPPTPSPTKYASTRPHRCQQCSKKYKTTSGLSNHVLQAHQKQSGGAATPTCVDSSPVSPAVITQLITQARAHGQAAQAQAAAALEQQRSSLVTQQRPLPVSVASSSTQQYGQAPLPVRSLPAPQARYSQHQISQQTTGQMLQQQIQQRRKEAQMVVQQAHLQVSQSQTLQSEQSRHSCNSNTTESGPIVLPKSE